MGTVEVSNFKHFVTHQLLSSISCLWKIVLTNDLQDILRKLFHFKHFSHSYFDLMRTTMTSGAKIIIFFNKAPYVNLNTRMSIKTLIPLVTQCMCNSKCALSASWKQWNEETSWSCLIDHYQTCVNYCEDRLTDAVLECLWCPRPALRLNYNQLFGSCTLMTVS